MTRVKQHDSRGSKELDTFNLGLLTKMATNVKTKHAMGKTSEKDYILRMLSLPTRQMDQRPHGDGRALLQVQMFSVTRIFLIVGDRTMIKPVKDEWIYKGSNTKIDHQLSILVVAEAKVSLLIQAEENHWDEEYIRQIITHEVACDILWVLLPIETCSDTLV